MQDTQERLCETRGRDRAGHAGETVQDTRERPVKGEKMKKKIRINLRLFEGEGGGAAAGSAAGSAAGAEGTAAQAQQPAGPTGTESQNQTDPAAEKSPEERMEEYRRFKKDFKDLYSRDVENHINHRFKETEQLRKQVDEYGPLMTMLSSKYGLEKPDTKTLLEAIEKDNSFWSEAAMEAGMSVDQFKQMKHFEAEHKQLIESARRAEQIRQREQVWERWNQEADACAQKFPGFDMDAELNNQSFVRLLGAGLDVESAYKAAHFDELAKGIATQTEQNTKKKVTDSIKAGSGRPVENGIGSGGANKTRTSAWDLSKEEFARYMERVRSGETIQTFD